MERGSEEGGASWSVFLDGSGICSTSSSNTMATRRQLGELPASWGAAEQAKSRGEVG